MERFFEKYEAIHTGQRAISENYAPASGSNFLERFVGTSGAKGPKSGTIEQTHRKDGLGWITIQHADT